MLGESLGLAETRPREVPGVMYPTHLLGPPLCRPKAWHWLQRASRAGTVIVISPMRWLEHEPVLEEPRARSAAGLPRCLPGSSQVPRRGATLLLEIFPEFQNGNPNACHRRLKTQVPCSPAPTSPYMLLGRANHRDSGRTRLPPDGFSLVGQTEPLTLL